MDVSSSQFLANLWQVDGAELCGDEASGEGTRPGLNRNRLIRGVMFQCITSVSYRVSWTGIIRTHTRVYGDR